MKTNKKFKLPEKFLTKLIMVISGLMILGVGVSLFISANLGVDPASTLELGMVKHTKLSYGTCAAIYNLIILIIVFLVDKKYINISSILAMFVIGYTVDFVNIFVVKLNISQMHILIRLFVVILGCFIASIGIITYIYANLGIGATDCVAEIISVKTKKSYRLIRVVSDLLLVILGYLLGGVVGVGTIIIAVILGPFIDLQRKWLKPIIEKLVGTQKEEIKEKSFEKEIIL